MSRRLMAFLRTTKIPADLSLADKSRISIASEHSAAIGHRNARTTAANELKLRARDAALGARAYLRNEAAMRVLKFLMSGTTGLVVNLATYWFLVSVLAVHYLLGSALAFATSVVVGFLLQKYWTFDDPVHGRAPAQFSLFAVLAVVNLTINSFAVYFLIDRAGVYYLVAQTISATALAVSNFFIYREFIFKNRSARKSLGGAPTAIESYESDATGNLLMNQNS
jgi:putative flippase GtrA